jgi:hypothetical protein
MLNQVGDMQHTKQLSNDLAREYASASLQLSNLHTRLKRSFDLVQGLLTSTRTRSDDLAASQAGIRQLWARAKN